MHRPSAHDWISRVVMLVLAGMVTLSIIGSIAAIPTGTIEGRMGLNRPPGQPVAEEAEPEARPAQQPRGSQSPAAEPNASEATGVAAAPPGQPEAHRWLEAITYALLALVGIAALATFLLWRGLRDRRRIADALESISLPQP